MPEIRTKTIRDAVYQVLIDCLRAARQSSNVTQVELASRLGTDQSYVSKYERAERRLDIIEVRSICKALGISFTGFISSFETELRKQELS
jgi:transcriptional regulator with XRE-family HTH domain